MPEVVRVVFLLGTIKTKFLRQCCLLINADIEEDRSDGEGAGLAVLEREEAVGPVRERQQHLHARPGAPHYGQGEAGDTFTLHHIRTSHTTSLALHQDQGELHGAEVLDGDDHVVVDGDVLPVHGEETLEAD